MYVYATFMRFPEWTFVVTQLNLFVIEFERTEMFRGQGQAGAHAMDVHADMHTLLRRVSRLSDGC